MKKFRMLLVCFAVLFCGIVFNSCGCSGGEVKPGFIAIVKVENASKDSNGNYVAAKGSHITISYEVGPVGVPDNVSILVDFLKDYVKTADGAKVFTGREGEINLQCLTASNTNPTANDLETITIRSGSGSASSYINLRIVEPKELDKVGNVKVDESHNLVWDKNSNTSNYNIILNHKEHGELISSEHKVSENKLDVSSLHKGVEYTAKVKAVGNNIEFKDGAYSDEYKFFIMPEPKISINNGVITFSKYPNDHIDKYELSFDELSDGSKILIVPSAEKLDIKNLDNLTLREDEKSQFEELKKFKLSIKAIPKSSSEINLISSSPITQEIIRLSVDKPELINNYGGETEGVPKNSILKWSNDANWSNFEYKIKFEHSDNNTGIINDTIVESQIDVYEYLKRKQEGSVVPGKYQITISAEAKENFEAMFINSGQVTYSLCVATINEQSFEISDDGNVEVKNIDNGFNDIIIKIESGEETKTNYCRVSRDENDRFICDISEYVLEGGELTLSVYGIGKISESGDDNYINYTSGASLGEVSKLKSVSELKLTKEGDLTFKFEKSEESDPKFYLIIEKISSDSTITVKKNLSPAEPNNGDWSVDLSDLSDVSFESGYSYNLGVKVCESGKISSSVIKLEEIKLLNNPENIKNEIDLNQIKNVISWDKVDNAEGYEVVVQGLNNEETVWENISVTNILKLTINDFENAYTQIKVSVQALGKDNKFLNSKAVEKIFDVSEFIEPPQISGEGEITISSDKTFYYSIIKEEEIFATGTLNSLDLKKLKDNNGASLQPNETYKIAIKAYNNSQEENKNYVLSGYKNFYFKINQAPTIKMFKQVNGYSLQFSGVGTYEYKLGEGEAVEIKVTADSSNAPIDESFQGEIYARQKGSEEGELSENKESPSLISSALSKVKVSKLACPELKIDEKTGEISWKKIANSKQYSLEINGTAENVPNQVTEEVSFVPDYIEGKNTIKIKAVGNIEINPKSLSHFTKDSDDKEIKINKPEKVDLNVNNGKIYWNYIDGAEYIVKLDDKVLDGCEISKETIGDEQCSSLIINPNDITNDKASVSVSVLVKDTECEYNIYSEFSKIEVTKFENGNDFKIENGSIVVPQNINGVDIANSYLIKGLKNKDGGEITIEIKKSGSEYELYLNSNSDCETISPDESYFKIGLDSLKNAGFEIKTGELLELTLTYVNSGNYVNTTKICSFKMLSMPNLKVEDGKLKITGGNKFEVKVYEFKSGSFIDSNVSVEIENNSEESISIDFSTEKWKGLAGGKIKIDCKTIGDEKIEISSQTSSIEANLAPKANFSVVNGELKCLGYDSAYSYSIIIDDVKSNISISSPEISTEDLGLEINKASEIQIETSYSSESLTNKLFNKGDKIKVFILNEVSDFKLNGNKLSWTPSANASGYCLKITNTSENSDNFKPIESTRKDMNLSSNESGKFSYSIRAIGTNGQCGSDGIYYLTNPDYGVSVNVEFVSKYVSEISGNNGDISWDWDYKNPIYMVNVYKMNEGGQGYEKIGNAVSIMNVANISPVLKAEGGGVYYVSIELSRADNIVTCTGSTEQYLPIVYFNSDNIFHDIRLLRGDICYYIMRESINEIINVLNSLPAEYKPSEDDINNLTMENLADYFKGLVTINNSLFSFFESIIAEVNGVDYKIKPIFDHPTSSGEDGITWLNFTLELGSGFGAGYYDIGIKYDYSNLNLEIPIIKGNSSKKIEQVFKPSSPHCPPTSACDPINGGELQFHLSKDKNGNYIEKYLLGFIDENNNVSLTLDIFTKDEYNEKNAGLDSDPNFKVYLNGYYEEKENGIATINLADNFVLQFFEERQILKTSELKFTLLEYNKLYSLSLQAAGTTYLSITPPDSEKRLKSESVILPNSFAKLKIEKNIAIDKDGCLDLSETYSTGMLNYISNYEITLTPSGSSGESEKVQFNFNSEELNSSTYLEGLQSGQYNVKIKLYGDKAGVLDSEEYYSGGLIEKLEKPEPKLLEGEFAFDSVKDIYNLTVEKYYYNFNIKDDNSEKSYSLITIKDDGLTKLVLPDNYNQEGDEYSLEIYAYKENCVRSDSANTGYYLRENKPNNFVLGENGELTWSATAGVSNCSAFVKYENNNVLDLSSIGKINNKFSIDINDDRLNLLGNDAIENVKIYVKAMVDEVAESGDENPKLNSANFIANLTIKKDPGSGVSENGEMVLADESDLDNFGKLLSNKYLIEFIGSIEVYNGTSTSWEKKDGKTLKIYLDRDRPIKLDSLFLAEIDCVQENGIYVYGSSNQNPEVVEKVRLIPGEQYEYGVRHIGHFGSIIDNDGTSQIVSSKKHSKNVKILNKVESVGIYNHEGNISGLSSDKSYIYWSAVGEANKYELVFRIIDENGSYSDLEYYMFDNNTNIVDSNSNSNSLITFSDGNYYLDITKAIEDIQKEGIDSFAICVRAIGSSGDYPKLSCNILSDYANIFVPKSPSDVQYDKTSGLITWINNSEDLTAFEIVIEYKPKGFQSEQPEYLNIKRTINYDLQTVTDVITLKYNSDKGFMTRSENGGFINDFVYDEVSKKVGYKLRYLAESISNIKVCAVSQIGNIRSEYVGAFLNSGASFELFDKGNGSKDEPFEISDSLQFGNIKHYLEFDFKLTSDIVISKTSFDDFKGVLDGGDFTITVSGDLKSEIKEGVERVYIFKKNSGEIKNIKLNQDAKIVNSQAGASLVHASGFVLNNSGKISKVNSSGTITNSSTEDVNVGILVYENSGTVERCINRAKIIGGTGKLNVGGIACINKGIISQCGNGGKLTGKVVGGICAYYSTDKDGTKITECYNKGGLISGAGGAYLGGIVAVLEGTEKGEISYCYTNLASFNAGSNLNSYLLGAGILAHGGIFKSGNTSSLNVDIIGCYVKIEGVSSTSNSYSPIVGFDGALPGSFGDSANNTVYDDNFASAVYLVNNQVWEVDNDIMDMYEIWSGGNHKLKWENEI